jgi:pimeloyl-ACP methyl ester carboxylesterase
MVWGVAAWLSIGAAAAQERIELAVRPGLVQPVYATLVARPVASLVLFPGGDGVYMASQKNFLVRIAPDLVRQGFSVLIADVPSDHAGGMTMSYRLGADHAAGIAAIVALAKSRAAAPVWLIGTSRGSVSAANGALRLGHAVSGLVLTSSVWADGMAGVPLDRIEVPVLIVHNRDDSCQASPFAGAGNAMRLITAPHELVTVSGGGSGGSACQAMSPHGYLGIEAQVVTPMVAFIRAHS